MYQARFCILVTFLFQSFPRYLFRSFKYIWIWVDLEYRIQQAYKFVQVMNKIHNAKLLNGDLITGFLLVQYQPNNRQGWVFLEDMVFDDLNSFKWSVWPGTYFSYIFGVPVMYMIQIWYLKAPLVLQWFSFRWHNVLYYRPKVWNYVQIDV